MIGRLRWIGFGIALATHGPDGRITKIQKTTQVLHVEQEQERPIRRLLLLLAAGSVWTRSKGQDQEGGPGGPCVTEEQQKKRLLPLEFGDWRRGRRGIASIDPLRFENHWLPPSRRAPLIFFSIASSSKQPGGRRQPQAAAPID